MRRLWLAAALALLGCGESRSKLVQVGATLSVSPALLDFGDVALGKQAQQQVTLENDGIVPLNVQELLAVQNPAFTVAGLPVTLAPGQALKATITYQPSTLGMYDATVQMLTDSPSASLASLPLHGHAVQGLATLSGDSFDFGSVVVNEMASQDLQLVNNDGHATTSVAVASPSGDGATAFTVAQQGSFTLVAEQSMAIHLQFKPPALGDFSAVVPVTPCPTCSPRNLTLTGHGVARLLDVQPSSIDFGQAVRGTAKSQTISLTNLSRNPLTLSKLDTGDASLSVSFGGANVPLTLAPGETLSATLSWTPTALGTLGASVTMTVNDGAPGVVAVTGLAYGPVLAVTPKSVYAGAAALGTTRDASVVVTNVGTDPTGSLPLVLSNLAFVQTDGAWSTDSYSGTQLPPGSSIELPVHFTPKGAGTSSATLVLDSNDGVTPHAQVPLAGTGRVLPPCQLEIEPSLVDFGPTQISQPSVQGFELLNHTTDDCIIGQPVLHGDAAFQWPGNVAPQGRTLPSGSRMSVRVEFAPQLVQQYAATVSFYVSNSAQQTQQVSLQGQGDSGCFFVSPATADFGATVLGCGLETQTVYAVNQCTYPISVTSVTTTGAPFGTTFAGAVEVEPQTNVAIPVTYQSGNVGDDVGALIVQTDMSPAPYRAGLTAGTQSTDPVFDQWQQSSPKVDLLIVIDNSGSMSEEQHALQQSLSSLWNRIAIANADFHIAVTTTNMVPVGSNVWSPCPGGADGDEAGRFFPVDGSEPRILTPQTANVQNALYSNVIVGTCSSDERFFDPVLAALTPPLSNGVNSGFLRDDARLSLLVLSDADEGNDEANPPPVAQEVQKLAALKHGALDLISFSGLVGLTPCPTIEQIGNRYMQISQAMNGTLYDVCQLDNMSTLLDNAIGDLMQPLTSFPLSLRPKTPSVIQVTVNGASVGGWTYDATANRIVFGKGSVPPPGSNIAALYDPACN